MNFLKVHMAKPWVADDNVSGLNLTAISFKTTANQYSLLRLNNPLQIHKLKVGTSNIPLADAKVYRVNANDLADVMTGDGRVNWQSKLLELTPFSDDISLSITASNGGISFNGTAVTTLGSMAGAYTEFIRTNYYPTAIELINGKILGWFAHD